MSASLNRPSPGSCARLPRLTFCIGAACAMNGAAGALAASLQWNNAAGGNAHVAGNWSPVQAPAAGDHLFFQLGGTYTVTYTVSMPGVLNHTYGSGANVTAQCTSPHSAGNISVFTNSSLTLASGTMQAHGSIVLGNVAGAPATLNLQGGSVLEGPTALNPGLLVGNNTGEGALNITGGARLLIDSNALTHVEIGNDASEVGDVTVSGAGLGGIPRSSLICQPVNDIELANGGGTGTVTITGGGLVNCQDMFVANNNGGSGEITVSGALPPLNFTRSTLAVSGDLQLAMGTILNNGDATLEIGDRGLVTVGGDTRVGSGVASPGFGTLRILPGGSLTTGSLIVADTDASLQHFGGTITIDGGILNTDDNGLILSGIDPASYPTVTLINDADVNLDGDVIIGAIAAASGVLNVRELGTSLFPLANGQIIVGDAAGASGTVNVEQNAGILANSASTTIIVGKDGTGVMNVNTAGSVFANNLRLGTQPTGDGTINLDGAGSQILLSNNLQIAGSNSGAGGTGVLNVTDSGYIDVNNDMVIWPDGQVNVNDATVNVDNTIEVRGTLDLAALATVRSLAGSITVFSNGTLSGEGTVQGDVTNNGTISPAGAGLTFLGGVTGTGVSFSGAPVYFGGVGGFTGAGLIDCRVSGSIVATITPTAALTMGRSGSGTGFAFDGTMLVGSNTVTLLDANFADGHVTELQGGTLIAANGFDVGGLPLTDSLRGHGTIQGNLRNSGGGVAPGLLFPGDQTGTLNVTGDFSMTDPAATTTIEIEGSGVNLRDRIIATGAVTLDGALTVLPLGGFIPANGATFTIISGASVSGTFDTVTLPPQVQVLYGPTTVQIRRVSCPADCAPVGGDGQVNVTDLLAVIGAWGACATCPTTHCAADIEPFTVNGDCQINVTDLLSVIGAWGACP